MQVVASQDWPEVTKYAGLVCAQAHRQELIQDLFKTWQDPVRGTVSGGMIRYENSTITSSLNLVYIIFALLFACSILGLPTTLANPFCSLDLLLALNATPCWKLLHFTLF